MRIYKCLFSIISTQLLQGLLFGVAYSSIATANVLFVIKKEIKVTFKKVMKTNSLCKERLSSHTLGFVLILIPASFVFQITGNIRITLCSTINVPCESTLTIEGNCIIVGSTAGYDQYPFEAMRTIGSIYRSIRAAATARNYHLMWAIESVYTMVCFSH